MPGFYSQFATRYAALLWDIEHIVPLAEPGERLAVRADREVWWEELAYERHPRHGQCQVLCHLVNPPPQEQIYHPEQEVPELPAPVRDLQVELRLRRERPSRGPGC